MAAKSTATHNGQIEYGGFGFFGLGLTNIAKIEKYLQRGYVKTSILKSF